MVGEVENEVRLLQKKMKEQALDIKRLEEKDNLNARRNAQIVEIEEDIRCPACFIIPQTGRGAYFSFFGENLTGNLLEIRGGVVVRR